MKKILLVAVNAKYIHSNLAVYSLRAYAEELKDNIELAEYTINNRTEYILREIYLKKPDVLCFSCYIWNISIILEVAEEFHKLCPDVPVWVGGPEVSYEVEAFMKENPFITGVVIGEGEKTFSELCHYYIKEEGDLQKIKGIAIRDEKGNVVIHEPQEILDMNTIPFCYDIEEDFSHRIIYYESSRGCPFRCSYCLSSVEKMLRFRNVEIVKKELQFFLDQKVKQVKFVDRTFNCDKNHAMTIWQYILEHDNGITNFHFEIAADLLTEEEADLIAKMRPGLIQLEIGVQSTNDATIREIHRHMDLKGVYHMMKKVQKVGNIHQHLDLIAGLPFEDYETFTHSFEDIYAWKPEQLQLGFLKVLKGSYMYEHAKEYEAVYRAKPPYEVLRTKWLSYEDICKIKLAEEMLEVYYNSTQFPVSIRLLETIHGSAYHMFEDLGHFYESHGYLAMSHTRLRRSEILLEYVKELGTADMEMFCQAATYDIYSRENAKSRPKWAEDHMQWKEVTRAYCPKGSLSHVERFDYSFEEDTFGKKCGPYYLKFDYENRNPLTHQAAVTKIDWEGEQE